MDKNISQYQIIKNKGKLFEMKTTTKNVRIPDDLIARVDYESSRTGRTRNAELVALLEEATVEMKYGYDCSLRNSSLLISGEKINLSGGDSYQMRIPKPLEQAIVDNFPGSVGVAFDADYTGETFSEKVRYLLLKGLSSRGFVVAVELESIIGNVYQDKEIEKKISGYKKGDSPKIDKMIELGSRFKRFMNETQGHVMLFGGSGTGKSFCAGFYKNECTEDCHFLDLMPQSSKGVTSRRVILFWLNDNKHKEMKTLIVDDAHTVDNDYLSIFLKKSEKKNVRVILTCQRESDFDDGVLDFVSHKLNLNSSDDGCVSWKFAIK